jgi:hypothetical protein
MANALPTPKLVKDLFEELLDRDVTVGPADPPRSGDLHRMVTAVYVDSALHLKALASMEVGLAAYTGAALGLVPAGGVRELLEKGTLPTTLVHNVERIFEKLIGFMGEPKLRLYQTFSPGQVVPGDVTGHLLSLGKRRDFTLTLQGYGKGRLSLVAP